jgi:hypothetical protein
MAPAQAEAIIPLLERVRLGDVVSSSSWKGTMRPTPGVTAPDSRTALLFGCLGKPLPEVFQIINEQSRKPVENPVTKVLRQGTVVGLANHTLLGAKDGTEKPIDDSGAPVREDRGISPAWC